MFEKEKDKSSVKSIPLVCRECYGKSCRGLYWKEVVVLSDYCAIPLDCPLRVKDEGSVFEVLSGLSAYDVSRMAGEVWVRQRHEPRYVNGGNLKAEEINHILSHFRRNLCVILSKSAAPAFKPWQHIGSYSEGFGYGMPPVPDRGKKREEPASDVASDEDSDNEKPPLEIKNLRWEHADEQLKKDTPDSAHEGGAIKLLADFENYVDGGGVDFILSDKSTGVKKQLKRIHTRCKNGASEVEWIVDVSKIEGKPDIIFEVEAGSLLSAPCEIVIGSKITYIIDLAIDPNYEKSHDDTIRLFSADDAKSYDKTLTVKADKKTDDNYLTLEFPDVDTSLHYSLEIDKGSEGEKYCLFKNKSLKVVSNG